MDSLYKTLKKKYLPEVFRYRIRIMKHNFNVWSGKRRDALPVKLLEVNENFFLIGVQDETIALPSIRVMWGPYMYGIGAHTRSIGTKYGLDRHYTLHPGETVIDVGGNVGEFSLCCLQHGATVHTVEADDRVFHSLTYNVRNKPIQLYNFAIWKEDTELSFYSNVDESDSSLITPDFFNTTLKKKAIKLDTFAAQQQLSQVKLIKCDAEGAEPEVLEGARELLQRVEWFCLDCGPERMGTPTYDTCAEMLRQRGFEIIPSEVTPYILLAHNTAFGPVGSGTTG